jgi:hypothetical protein
MISVQQDTDIYEGLSCSGGRVARIFSSHRARRDHEVKSKNFSVCSVSFVVNEMIVS